MPDELIEGFRNVPETQLDPKMRDWLLELKGKPDEEKKTGLHKILDHCARFALASSFVMTVLNKEWELLGGKVTDPAPWQEAWK